MRNTAVRIVCSRSDQISQRRRARLALAAALALGAALIPALPGQAAGRVEVAATTTTQGTLLDDVRPPSVATSVSAATSGGQSYLAVSLVHEDDALPCAPAVVRVADGALMPVPGIECPESRQLVWGSLTDLTSAQYGAVSLGDPATGRIARTWSFPTGSAVLAAEPTWLLFVTPDAGVGVARSLVLRRATGADLTLLTAVGLGRSTVTRRVDDRTALVVLPSGPSYLDVVTGALTAVPVTIGATDRVVHGPTRLFWIANVDSTHQRVHWVDRGTTEDHSVVVAKASGWFAYGSGLAVAGVDPVTGGSALLPVDLDAGNRQAAVAPGTTSYGQMDGGRVFAQSQEGAVRRVLVLEAGRAPRVVYTVPPENAQRAHVTLSGTAVITNADATYEPVTATVGGDGVWRPLDDGSGTPVAGTLVDTDGGVIVTVVGVDSPDRLNRVTWVGGHRDLPGSDQVSVLPGGQVVARMDLGTDPQSWELQETGTGRVLARVDPYDRPFTVDALRLWQVPDGSNGSVVTLTDLATPSAPARRLATGVACERVETLSASGRWLHMVCAPPSQGGPRTAWMVDTLGVVAPWAADVGMVRGGYLFARRGVGTATPSLAVIDLGSRATRLIGPVTSIAGDWLDHDPRSGRLVYLDSARRVRWLTLPQATSAPAGTPDVTAPTVTVAGPPFPAVDATSLALTWVATDGRGAAGAQVSGVADTDLRYRSAATAGGALGAWVYPGDLQATQVTSTDLVATPDGVTCIQVRARDLAGNVGPWSVERCWGHDATPPTTPVGAVGSLVAPTVTGKVFTFQFSASDDVTVAAFDWRARSAASGGPLGAATTPPTTAAGSLGVRVDPGGEACAQARARDGMDRAGAWSSAVCVAVPWDDRALKAVKGPLTRGTTTMALAQTVTLLNGKGAEVASPAATGAQVALVVLRGVGQGAVDVYAGTTRLGRVSLVATGWRRDVVLLPARAMTRTTVRVVSVSSAPARIDALAVLR